MLVCEAAGFDVVIVETVGVGQSEIGVRAMVDFFAVLLQPGAGDELQGMKRGVLELADALVVTKADGDQRGLAERTRGEHAQALELLRPPSQAWAPAGARGQRADGGGDRRRSGSSSSRSARRSRPRASSRRRRQHQARDWMWSLVQRGPGPRLPGSSGRGAADPGPRARGRGPADHARGGGPQPAGSLREGALRPFTCRPVLPISAPAVHRAAGGHGAAERHGPDQHGGARDRAEDRLLRSRALRQDDEPPAAPRHARPRLARQDGDARHQGRPHALLRLPADRVRRPRAASR